MCLSDSPTYKQVPRKGTGGRGTQQEEALARSAPALDPEEPAEPPRGPRQALGDLSENGRRLPGPGSGSHGGCSPLRSPGAPSERRSRAGAI